MAKIKKQNEVINNSENTDTEEVFKEVEQTDIKDFNQLIAEMRHKAFKKVVVTISSNDVRESSVVDTAYLTCENMYFGISRLVPLNVPVELEQCLVDVAKELKITIHVEEVKNGVKTGNCETRLVNKYNVQIEG